MKLYAISLCSLLMIPPLASTPVSAQATTFGEPGDWTVRRSSKNICSMGRVADPDKSYFAASFRGSGDESYWEVIYYRKDWEEFPAGKSFQMQMTIDEAAWHESLDARVLAKDTAGLVVKNLEFTEKFRNGKALTLTTPTATYNVSLEGIGGAMDVLLNCVEATR